MVMMTIYARQRKRPRFERIALKHVYYHVKQMTSPSLMNEAGHSKLVLWNNPDGWGGEGGGRGFRMGRHVHLWPNSCQCMAKNPTIF